MAKSINARIFNYELKNYESRNSVICPNVYKFGPIWTTLDLPTEEVDAL